MTKRGIFSILVISLLFLTACSETSETSTESKPNDVFYSECGYGYSQKPSSVTLTCADGGMYIDNVTYSNWTSSNAEGIGTFNMNDCNPDCSSGSMTQTQVTISIGKPRADSQGKVITDAKRAFFIGNALVVGLIERVGKVLAQEMKKL